MTQLFTKYDENFPGTMKQKKIIMNILTRNMEKIEEFRNSPGTSDYFYCEPLIRDYFFFKCQIDKMTQNADQTGTTQIGRQGPFFIVLGRFCFKENPFY